VKISKNLKIKICRITIVPLVLCGCKTCSLTLRDERRLRVLENRVLRRIFRPKRDKEGTVNNGELNHLYTSPNIVRVIKSIRIRWVGHVACMGERRSLYRILVGKPEGKRPLGRPRLRWEDYINLLTPDVNYSGRTAPLTSKVAFYVFIQQI